MEGVEKILQLFNIKDSLTDENISEIYKHTSYKVYNASELIVKERDTSPYLFFIMKGLVRYYIIKENGMEITPFIMSENEFVASFDIIFFDRPSKFYIQALEETEVLVTNYDVLNKIIESNPALLKTKIKVLENILKLSITKNESFTLLTPEERYVEILKDNPSIIERVADKYVANALGITPVSFSRIKKRVSMRSS